MDWLVALAFAAGAAGFAYSKLGRHVGYGNQQNVWTIVGVVFVLTWLIFLTILKFFVPHN
ncbi:MAG TPA: hypothetical protein VG604_03700 [Candidatus Saccharimonadales bacterium]|nr:hypothetical protein [Candidatus Saccharimonadales bacterium]